MPLDGVVPGWLLSIVAVTTLFTVMLDLGLALEPREFGWVWQNPGRLLRGLFAVLVAVPAVAWLVLRAVDLPHAAEVGIMVMAISPGAPVALRRSLGAGAHRSFAPALQIAVATLAFVSMPLSIAFLDEYYGGNATGDPALIARQVFVAQLLPLGLGMALRHFFRSRAEWLEPRLRRIGGLLLAALLVLALINIWREVLGAGPRVALAIAVITLLALATGHLLGGPDASTRTAMAISCAARNPGLALLIVTLNGAPPLVARAVLAYLVIAAITATPYVLWRQRLRP